jgi:FkbM family methyltransferase
MAALREGVRDLLPSGLHPLIVRSERYVKRLAYWSKLMLQVRGSDRKDRLALWRAFSKAPVVSLRCLDRWQDPMVESDVSVEVKGVGRFRVRAHSDDLHHVLPSREPEVFGAIARRLRRRDTFVDAGANIGFYTVLAAGIVGPQGRVIAIEMMPDNAAILREHVRINGLTNVEVVEGALSDKAGERVLAYVDDGKYGQASIADPRGERSVEVMTTTLEEILGDVPYVRLMKMDLEGAELKALQGAGQRLESIRAIIAEALPEHGSAQNVLVERGFAVARLDGRNWIASRE